MSSANPEEVPEIDFEQAMGELEGIVRRLEEGKTGLQDSLEQYERGVKLLRLCHGMIEKAERRIEVLTGVDAAGNPVCRPWDDRNSTLEEKAEARSRRRSANPGDSETEDSA